MREPYWHDPTATLYLGAARDVMDEMPAASVDCIITRPPRWNPDDNPSTDIQDVENRLAYAATPALYVAALRRVCVAAHRVLADDGTFWLVLGDRYGAPSTAAPTGRHARRIIDRSMTGLPASSLIGLPWQVAFALHDDGWLIRNSIVWNHGDTGITTHRTSLTYELIFRLTKQDADRHRRHSGNGTHECRTGNLRRRGRRHAGRRGTGTYGSAIARCRDGNGGNHGAVSVPPGNSGTTSDGNEPRDVWNLPGSSFLNGLPTEVLHRCITTGCRLGGTVLDPFAGIATTGITARELGRSFIGIEANAALCEIAKTWLSQTADDSGEEPE